MNEVKTPKKPLIFYYGVTLLVLVLFNFLMLPHFVQSQIQEVDYGTFMSKIEEGKIDRVEIQSNKILFTEKEGDRIYKTGLMDDSGLTERLYRSGATFASEIIEQTSPFLSFLLSWVLPLLVFFGIGQLMTRQMMKKAGGGSMIFNMGKSRSRDFHLCYLLVYITICSHFYCQ